MITVHVNGQPREIEPSLTVERLLSALGVHNRFVAVAVNGEVVDRDAFPSIRIQDGDSIEIVRPVGGG